MHAQAYLMKRNRYMSTPDLWSIDQSLVNKADSGSVVSQDIQ